jgi:hypothetical protein
VRLLLEHGDSTLILQQKLSTMLREAGQSLVNRFPAQAN